MNASSAPQKILTIDIGGSHVKATLLDATGNMIADYKRVETPVPATPETVIAAIKGLAANFENYDVVSAGFPGYVKEGKIITAPNLGSRFWQNTDLQQQLAELLGKPAVVVNDADLQGAGIAKGKGLELVATLGTGFGTALLYNGKLLPHFEISHHPVTKTKDYDEYIGEKALNEVGKVRWNKRMERVIGILKTVFNYDYLYLGGGNSDKITFKLDDNITIVNNRDGIKGGAKLWLP
jgi:polyphosphate glucokinase